MGLGNSLSDQRHFRYPHSLAAGRSIYDIDATRILISSQRQHPSTEAMGEERLRALYKTRDVGPGLGDSGGRVRGS